MGVPGFLNISDKKKSVYVVENGQPTPQPEFSPVGRTRTIRTPLSSRSATRVVALFELLAALFFWFPLLNVTSYVFNFVEAAWNGWWPAIGADNPEGTAVIGILARLVASVILFIGTYRNGSWYSVPYLMVQMTLLIGGPFIFVYSSLGYDPNLADERKLTGWMLMLPFLLIFIWVEYAKWRIVYTFYDSVSSKNVSSEFAKMLDNKQKNENETQNQSTLDADSYLKQVYTSAQMQEIDPKEVESLLPLQTTEEPSKKFSFDNVKLELKE